MSADIVSEASFVRRSSNLKFSSSSKSSSKLYGEDSGGDVIEYGDDVDKLLVKLTQEELEELNDNVDPDNSMLPPSQRCKDQTKKEPTGPYKRELLLKFMEEEAKKEKDWKEKVPFRKGIKRGAVFTPKDEPKDPFPFFEPGDMPIELDVDDEYVEALTSAKEQDLVDLAGILGLHNMLNQVQYYNALKGKPQDCDQVSFTGVVKTTALKLMPDEPPNLTNVDECIKRLNDDDSSLTEVNINNIKNLSKEKLKKLINAVKDSKSLKTFTMANTAVTDTDAQPLIESMEQNDSVTVLNVESNFLSGEFLTKLLKALLKNQTVVELHAENQRAAVLGHKVEMEIVEIIEQNETLLRLGLTFQSMEARHRVSDALERNLEKRLLTPHNTKLSTSMQKTICCSSTTDISTN